MAICIFNCLVHPNMSSKVIISAILIILIYIDASFSDVDDGPRVVTLPNGKIKGHVIQTAKYKVYYAFQEIPYAAPPVGELRFKEPVAPEPWSGILDTDQNRKICYQQNRIHPGVIQTEDCLYLNVYTPFKPGGDSDVIVRLPVVVWIHGGGFTGGDGSFQTVGPQFFIDSGVVVVTINYRLGAFGFLTTEDGVIPGNLALKDQNFALQWVKKNIHLFGGDPEKITIAGESAGGAAVGFQLISKKSKGLFRGAIMQSTTALSSVVLQKYARYYAFKLGRALSSDFSSSDSAELLTLLQSIPAVDIINADMTVDDGRKNGVGDHSGLIWAPVIEDEELEGAFITNPMHEDVKNGKINKVPILLGFNSEEEIGFIAHDSSALRQEATSLDDHITKLIGNKFTMNEEDKIIAGNKLKEIYTNGQFKDHFGSLVKFMSDEGFTTPTTRHADLQSSYTDVYLYQFSYKGVLGGLLVDIEDVDNGVGHAEDVRYMWSDSSNSDITQFPEQDILTHQRVMKLWSNFIKYLNPTPEKDSLLNNVIWQKVTPDNLTYLDIDTTLEVKTNPKQYQKWKEIIDAYAIPPLYTY